MAVSIRELRPTQMTVGFAEVRFKRQEWADLTSKARRAALDTHLVPCVIGPKQRRYIIDHHHLCLALLEEGASSAWTQALEDYSWLDSPTFWRALELRRWVHPYDATGCRREFREIPKHLEQLHDDPYRSLAAQVRRAGGFSKDVEPYAEFAWADFFRDRVKLSARASINATAVRAAVRDARSAEARYLPGWSGRWIR